MSNLQLRRRLSDWLNGKRAKTLHFEAIENPPPELRDQVQRSLVSFNNQHLPSTLRLPVGVFVRDDADRLRGGACGYICWDWLETELLWVDDNLRADGLGSRLLAQLERMALAKGVYRFKVLTASFQALDFYKKNGYEVYATLEDCPPGHTEYSLRKIIDLSGSE